MKAQTAATPDADRDAAVAARITRLCRHIETHADAPLDLATLAALVHWSPQHLQRRFKAATGVSPKQYQSACRQRRLRDALREQARVTDAIHSAGYGSASRVYEHAAAQIGMTPKQYRDRGAQLTISHASADTALGRLMLGATDRGLCFVQFGADDRELLAMLQREFPAATLAPAAPETAGVFAGWMQALAAHLAKAEPLPALPVDIRGTAFQMRVWHYLQQIPSGSLQSYTDVAQALGVPNAVRAVASACARNRIALLIPCHRVIRGDGALAGYKWGLERKRALIDAERHERETTKKVGRVRRAAP